MIEVPYLPPQLPNGDRSGRFVAAGVILLLVALLGGCLIVLTPVGVVIQQQAARSQRAATQVLTHNAEVPTWFEILPAMAIYVGFTMLAAWLGIAALRKLRYVRPLVLVLSVHWLIVGSLSVIGAAVMTPLLLGAGRVGAAPPQMWVGIAIAIAFLGLFLVGLPLLLLMLMNPEAVRETAEHYDLRHRWTDNLPMPLLGLILTMGVWALLNLMMLAQPRVPVGPVVLTGVAAGGFVLLQAGVFAWATLAICRRRVIGWKVAFWAMTLQLANFALAVITLPTDHFAMMLNGRQADNAEIFLENNLLFRSIYLGVTALFLAGVVVYMLRVRSSVARPMAVIPSE